MLQAQYRPQGRSVVYSVTSACAGDGKTSIAYALGVSFAAAGDETIVVDADLVGCGLTRQLGLTRAEGLREAIPRTELNGEIHATGVAGLWALPVGVDERFEAPSLSPAILAPLLERLRGRFAVVIVDTGPILGSLEAGVVSRLSDRVVLVVSRGQSPRALKAAAQQVRRLGATCAGLVFNRATGRDFDRSTSVGSFRSRSVGARPPGTKGAARQSLGIFDSPPASAGAIARGGEL
jgi:tyrosine-protein kinase Etk/Wzc